VSLQLASEEPEAGPWRVELLTTVIADLTGRGGDRAVAGRPVILAVDGRSDGGKTTLSDRICQATAGSVVVHTDDIAWEHSRFGWADRLVSGVLIPAREGQPVRFRPPPWIEHGRAGAIEVPAGCPLVIIEGDGAGRREVAHLIDALIWVQTDERVAEQRRIERSVTPNASDLVNMPVHDPWDHVGWMAEEVPFNSAQRTWERADIIVCGSPEIPSDPVTEVVVAPPPR
jgi:hypothetical protein